MAQEAERIDISNMPDLVRLAEEVARSRKPRLLTRGEEEVALLSPAGSRTRRKAKSVTDADIKAALAASWVGLVDPEKLKRELDEARGDDRPPLKL
ncbi:MAG: hypothetical protein AB7U18_11100 [Dehalococcoidia bacterium]